MFQLLKSVQMPCLRQLADLIVYGPIFQFLLSLVLWRIYICLVQSCIFKTYSDESVQVWPAQFRNVQVTSFGSDRFSRDLTKHDLLRSVFKEEISSVVFK